MPIVRKKVKCDFTTVHNAFLRDNKLGATARGVLLTMISMPENWKFSIKGLSAILPDGERKISTALKEPGKQRIFNTQANLCKRKNRRMDLSFQR